MEKLLSIITLMSICITGSAQIDVHCHMIPDSYLDAVKAHGMEMDEGFPIPSWNAEEHLKFMDEAGIKTSVLTMPAPQPYFGDGVQSAAICRKFNEEAAALKALHPGRFLFCAALPLPDVNLAIEEARYALDVLGADGVKLATNSYGQYLGDEELDPLMAFLNSRKAIIITHPHKPSSANDKLIAAVPLASYEYLAEIEVVPEKLSEDLGYAKEVGTVSMATEPGVIGLFSMQDESDSCRIYILEVYADQEAYLDHLKTAHFKKYKEGTADMVKSLKLIDTNPMVTAALNKSAIL